MCGAKRKGLLLKGVLYSNKGKKKTPQNNFVVRLGVSLGKNIYFHICMLIAQTSKIGPITDTQRFLKQN